MYFYNLIICFIRNYKALGLAFRLVLDALKKQTDTKLYFFGITALDCFKNRLKDYDQYCSHIIAIPHFNQFPRHLIEVSLNVALKFHSK